MKKLYLAIGVLILLAGVFFVGRWTAPSPPVKAPEKVVDDKHDVQETADAIRAKKYKVVLDSHHGAGSVLGRVLLESLGCDVQFMGGTPDGLFTRSPEPTRPY